MRRFYACRSSCCVFSYAAVEPALFVSQMPCMSQGRGGIYCSNRTCVCHVAGHKETADQFFPPLQGLCNLMCHSVCPGL